MGVKKREDMSLTGTPPHAKAIKKMVKTTKQNTQRERKKDLTRRKKEYSLTNENNSGTTKKWLECLVR